MELNDRIRKIRKDNKMTQVEFGKIIGVKGNTITNYENGLRNPTEAIILSICREFCVNEDWLLKGEGEPYLKDSLDKRYLKNVGKLQRADNETISRWVNTIAETSPDTLREVEAFMKKILGIEED